MRTQDAYIHGYNCGYRGVADETNSHFSIFSDNENTEAWERGKKEGEAKRFEETQKKYPSNGSNK